MALDPLTAGLQLGETLIKRIFKDPEQHAIAQNELYRMAAEGDLEQFKAQVSVIVAESQSESGLTRTWRPITMLTFVSLVVAHFLGFTAPNISPEQVDGLLEIVKYGLTGYIIGRSTEKGLKIWKQEPSS